MVYNFQQGMMAGASAAVGGYTIDYACRFNSADSAYLSFTPGSAGTRTSGTVSVWIKKGKLGVGGRIIDVGSSTSNRFLIGFDGNDQLEVFIASGGSSKLSLLTNARFRDTSAWYHIHFSFNTVPASPTYTLTVNGVTPSLATSTNNMVQNDTYELFNNVVHRWGAVSYSAGSYFDGYMSQACAMYGASAYTNFGEFDTNGVWRPIEITGLTYGTNGFLLDFADSATLGNDVSGNNNDFTSSGLTSADQVTDTPTNVFATLSAVDNEGLTLSDGNLVATHTATNYKGVRSTFALPSTGKWGFKVTTPNVDGTNTEFGVGLTEGSNITWANITNTGVSNVWAAGFDGNIRKNGSDNTAATVKNKTLEFLYDATNAQCIVKDITGTPSTLATITSMDVDTYYVFARLYGSISMTFDFGQAGYVPTDTAYKALCTANLPEPSIKDGSAHFQATLYTGTGSSLTVNQSGNSTFTPDFAWLKGRSGATDHALYDILRGTQARLESNNVDAEVTTDGGVTAFGAGSLTLGTLAQVNTNTATYAAWQWKANGAGVSNNTGTITSTVSANQTAGFSVVTYTGTGSAATIGHGLGIAPKLIVVKKRSGTDDWAIYHASIGATKYLRLDTTDAATTSSLGWNDTSPTSSVFSVGTGTATNSSAATYVAYCFAEIDGFCKIGSYIGNASANGPFVYCGFKPALVIIKKSSASNSWWLQDSARNPYNVVSAALEAQSAVAEVTTNRDIDLTSNGFKIRNANDGHNGSSGTYIYIAFAQHPFGGSGVSPATAR